MVIAVWATQVQSSLMYAELIAEFLRSLGRRRSPWQKLHDVHTDVRDMSASGKYNKASLAFKEHGVTVHKRFEDPFDTFPFPKELIT